VDRSASLTEQYKPLLFWGKAITVSKSIGSDDAVPYLTLLQVEHHLEVGSQLGCSGILFEGIRGETDSILLHLLQQVGKFDDDLMSSPGLSTLAIDPSQPKAKAQPSSAWRPRLPPTRQCWMTCRRHPGLLAAGMSRLQTGQDFRKKVFNFFCNLNTWRWYSIWSATGNSHRPGKRVYKPNSFLKHSIFNTLLPPAIIHIATVKLRGLDDC